MKDSYLSKESFYNGKLAYLLKVSSSTWGQNLSSRDSLPNPCASDKYSVYKTCTGYTNDVNEVHHSVVNGFCTNDGCDYYEEPHFNVTDDVYEISNAGQLYAYADKAQTVYAKGARLMADIVVNEETLIENNGTPITKTAELRKWEGLFRGGRDWMYYKQQLIFDGNNHSISGLYAKGNGLQGFVLYNYGTVKNLQIKNSVFISTGNDGMTGNGAVGGIVAGDLSGGNPKIENCSFEGYVEGTEYTGGIAGSNRTTSNCYADAYVKGSGTVNPIVAYGYSRSTITNTAYNIDKYTDGCTTSGVQGFTTDQFASGEVAYALNQGSSDVATDTWKQTLDGENKDGTPTLNTAKAKVYQYTRLRCDGATKTTDDGKYGYTNDASKSGTSIPDEHVCKTDTSDHTKHTCSVCGKTEVHTYIYQVADDMADTIQAVCDACGDSYTVKLIAPVGAAGKLTYTGYGPAARTGITGGVLVETLPDVEYATVTDGTVSAYSTDVPVNAGSYRAKLTLGSGDNAASATVDYTIAKAVPLVSEVPTVAARVYDPGRMLTAGDLTGGAVNGVDGKPLAGAWSFTEKDIIPAVANKGYQAVFTPEDTTNYESVTKTVTVPVSRTEKPFNAPEGEMCPAHSTAKVGDIRLPEGWCWLDSDREKELSDDVTVTATAVYTGEDQENYEKVSISIAITRSSCEHKNTTKGTRLKDATGAAYKVTSANGKTPAVQYLAPKSGAKGTVTVPAAVTIDGITYKVTSIADNAFKGNKKIKKIVIGSNITSIGKNAFAGCTGLTSITIGKNVTKIGKNAFTGCKKLKSITIKTKKLTNKSVAKKAFSGISKKVTIKVPKSKYKTYKKLLPAKGLKKTVKIRK